MQTPTDTESNIIVKLERQSAFISEWSSGGSANKTILKPRLALATRRQRVGPTWDFPDVKFRLDKAAKFRSLYDISESNPVPASGL